ncbi:hypothetical protein FEM48_Zijuj09G0176600 [Ziziphus jujuba var. spinosa]|uniref:Uncharacterized protein n=1 Tax=Ziziphus jujuba var. spinosa TaxID=714518 RepID=A0A978UUD7_ZIZJJ|nr:hypothetical protein FEM48_Zijuj09G0176600 [Ziziphus jujuba var. spinosa]
MSSFGNLDDFEGSFSFSTTAGSNFNSEDEDADDNEYIEIALDHHHHHHHHNQSKHHQREEDDLDYFRISFSSPASPPFPELIISESDRTTQTLPNPKTTQPITFSDDSAIYTPTPSSSSSSSLSACSSSSGFYNTRRRRILDSLLLSFRVPSPESFSAKGSGGGDENQKQSQLSIHHADNGDPLRNSNTRKFASSKFKTSATMNNSSGIMKLFIKLRGIKIASIVKPRRVGVAAVVPPQGTPDNNNNINIGYNIYNKKTSCETVDYNRRLIKPLDKRLLQRNKDQMTSSRIKSSRDQVGEKSSRVLEMNMGAVRGALEAMGIAINGRKDRKTRSCPSSIKSSPLHEGVPSDQYCYYKSYSRENSIQSAIAHCKTSFARSTLSDDFSF